MEYSLSFTKQHPLSKHSLESINSILKNEGGKGLFQKDTLAINLDDVEKSFKKSQSSNTMDIALGINISENKNSMLLCEIKLRVDYPKNLSSTEIKSKVTYSRTLIRNNYDGLLEHKNYFLFKKEQKNQAKNTISRIFNSRSKEYEVLTEQEFAELLKVNN